MTLVLKGSTSEVKVEYSLGIVDFLVRHGARLEKQEDSASGTTFRVADPQAVYSELRTVGLL